MVDNYVPYLPQNLVGRISECVLVEHLHTAGHCGSVLCCKDMTLVLAPFLPR